MKKRYIVNGMSCTACSNAVERVVKKIDGVKSATVNLTSKLLVVEGDVISDNLIFLAVKKAGFSATLYNSGQTAKKSKLALRLTLSIILLVILIGVVAIQNLGNLVPNFISKNKNPIIYVLVQIILALAIIVLNFKYYINGVKAIINKAPNMDTLIFIGSFSAFIFGVYNFVKIIISVNLNNLESAISLASNLYLESSAMILTLVSIGKTLEERSKKSTQFALNSLKKLAPTTATVIRNGEEVSVNISQLKVGDILAIKEGESVPADAVIISGECEVDEKVLTGESIPLYKTQNDTLKAVTTLISGYATARVIAIGEDTAFSKIVSYVLNAQGSKPPIQKLADKISAIFVPCVVLISIITLIVWLIIGKTFDFALTNAISVLVVSCPCALGLATPVSVTVAVGKCAQNGILVKEASVFEVLNKVNSVYFDKTGTVTKGNLVVDGVYNLTDTQIKNVAKIESLSSHPIAKAICLYISGSDSLVTNFKSVIGKGVLGTIDGKNYKIGNLNFILDSKVLNENCSEFTKIINTANSFVNGGKTVLYVSENDILVGVISIKDAIKETSIKAVKQLKNLGIKTALISGDNALTTTAVQKELEIDQSFGEVLPTQKANIVENGKQDSVVAFVGDGVNDSPAITSAHVGFAVMTGTDIAVSMADVVLVKSDLLDVVGAIKISKKAVKIIKQNLFWAFCYNALAIPLACGVFYGFGVLLNPMIASAFMSVSSLIVVLNALRIKR
ncbi:MAG: copper-translocating P-type ATPase [Clostridia bacterium]|nr:copper-translocating P-type ATPase [Clostridia bacterium]